MLTAPQARAVFGVDPYESVRFAIGRVVAACGRSAGFADLSRMAQADIIETLLYRQACAYLTEQRAAGVEVTLPTLHHQCLKWLGRALAQRGYATALRSLPVAR